tara:strand:- start:1083 stop:1487 length:405 start_codon:yes stop_codon:yes gene_type:complete
MDESQRSAYYQWLNAVAAESIYTHVPQARPRPTSDDSAEASVRKTTANEWGPIARYCDRLPDHELQVFKLRVGYGLKFREIAEQLTLPMGTVHSRIARAWQRIQEWAAEDDIPVPATDQIDGITSDNTDEEQAS